MADEEGLLNSDRVLALVTKVEEVTRSTDGGVKHFIEPARGTLSRATSRRHHLIFGRRGSGKSSLLRKAAADLALDRRPNAYVNLEAFKGSSYPDVLLSVLISTFERFNDWLETTTLSDYLTLHAPLGRVYLPTASYEEMMGWALPVEAAREFDREIQELVAVLCDEELLGS